MKTVLKEHFKRSEMATKLKPLYNAEQAAEGEIQFYLYLEAFNFWKSMRGISKHTDMTTVGINLSFSPNSPSASILPPFFKKKKDPWIDCINSGREYTCISLKKEKKTGKGEKNEKEKRNQSKSRFIVIRATIPKKTV